MAIKEKYLSYLEDTKKHHGLIEKVAQASTRMAIATSHKRFVPVTFMEGEKIIKLTATDKKSVLGTVKNNRRKVQVGAKAKISKE